jgi:hypothetical protein
VIQQYPSLSPNYVAWLESTGTNLSCKSPVGNTSDVGLQAQDHPCNMARNDEQDTSILAHNLVNPEHEHTDYVPLGLPELHKVLISLLEPLQSRLELLLQAQQGTLPPACPNGPAAAGQQDSSSFVSAEEYSGENKAIIPSCSQWQRSKLSSQSYLHFPRCSVFDSCKNVRVTGQSPKNTLNHCDDDPESPVSCRRPRQLRKLHHMLRLQQSVPPVQRGEGQTSFKIKDNCLEGPGAAAGECQPRHSTWMSRSQKADDEPAWESFPTADTETVDTTFQTSSVRRRSRRLSRNSSPALRSCDLPLHSEDTLVMAQLLDVLKAEELCWGGHTRPSSEVSGIDFAIPATTSSFLLCHPPLGVSASEDSA